MEELKDLIELIKKELKEVGTKGLGASNLESTSKLVDILKDLMEVESGGKESSSYQNYGAQGSSGNSGGYNMPYMEGYARGSYNERGGYNERGNSGGGRSYNGYDNRMRDKIERVIDGAENYEYGRDRYQHGGSHEAMEEGLEKMMYAICMLVETAMDAAQSSREKEIIRKHIQKIKTL